MALPEDERHHTLGRDTRALTHPPMCNRTHHSVIRGRRGQMADILDSMPLFGVGHRDVIKA